MKAIDSILVTGGAGFIGSHTVDLLVDKGYDIKILDSLEPQVHGLNHNVPSYLRKDVKLVRGNINNRKLLKKLVRDIDAVIHLAAIVGVGQSMYEVNKYIDTNTLGIATLLDVLVNDEHNVKKLVIASSMSIYGEGKYLCNKCNNNVFPSLRSTKQLAKKLWEHICQVCGSNLDPVPTDEEKPLDPASVYAMSKRHQEEMSLLIGKTYNIPTVALRYFNVYGSRQALSNPYTGAAAIFTSRILNGKAPYIFEDGKQSRDFIHVSDVARANLLALTNSGADYSAVNIASGNVLTISELAEHLLKLFNSKLKPHISYKYRAGDVRHCFADVRMAKETLGFVANKSFEEGLIELIGWISSLKKHSPDKFMKALSELRRQGLAI